MMTILYASAALVFVSYPVGTFLYIKYNLHSYRHFFALASILFLFALLLYLLLTKGKLAIDGHIMLYEKTNLRFPRFNTEKGPIQVDNIKEVELIKDRYGNHTFTITISDGRSVHLIERAKDVAGLVDWLNAECKDKIIEKGYSEKNSYKIGCIVIGTLLLDIVLVFIAIYFGNLTNRLERIAEMRVH